MRVKASMRASESDTMVKYVVSREVVLSLVRAKMAMKRTTTTSNMITTTSNIIVKFYYRGRSKNGYSDIDQANKRPNFFMVSWLSLTFVCSLSRR